MTETPTADALRADIRSTGNPVRPDTIAPEDQHYADAILAMDPWSIPNTNIEITPGLQLPSPRVTTLPPGEVRSEIEAALRATAPEQRDEREAALVGVALRKMLPAIRSTIGAGEGAPPYHREASLIAGEYRYLAELLAKIDGELDEASGYRAEVDPSTGEAVAVAIPLYDGDGRTSREAQRAEIARRMRSLVDPESGAPGVEARRRLGEALRESVMLAKQRDQQVAEAAEVTRRAEEMIREDRINAQAKARANVLRTTM